MKTRQLTVVEPGRIELQELDLEPALEPHEALVEAEYSIVSAGTEGAGFTGLGVCRIHASGPAVT